MSIPQRDDVQVIVVDDCSTKHRDELAALRKEFNAVEWYDTGTNGGGGKARNIGLRHAKGKYVIFADSDDYFEPVFGEVLDDYKDKDVDIAFFNGISRDTNTAILSNRTDHLNRFIEDYHHYKEKGANELRYLFGEPWCKMIHRALIADNGIQFEEINIHNDTTFSYQIGYIARTICVDDRAIYCVTTREDSVSVAVSTDRVITRIKVFSRAEKYFTANRIPVKTKEPYLQLIRLLANGHVLLFLQCIPIIRENGFAYGHIFRRCIKVLIGEVCAKYDSWRAKKIYRL